MIGSGVEAGVGISQALPHTSLHSGTRRLCYWRRQSSPQRTTMKRLRTGLGRFNASMQKWGLADSAACECGNPEQSADHIIHTCPLHRPVDPDSELQKCSTLCRQSSCSWRKAFPGWALMVLLADCVCLLRGCRLGKGTGRGDLTVQGGGGLWLCRHA